MPSVLAAAALSGGPHLAEHSSPFFIYISSPVLCGWLLLCERGSWYFEFSSNYFWRDVHYGSSAATGQSHTVSDLCRGAHPLALALPLVAPPCGSHSGWRRVVGRAFYDFCLVGDFYTTQNVTANKSSWFQDPGAAHEWEESTSVVQLPLWGGFGFWQAEAAPPCHPIVSLGLWRIGFGSRFK